MRAEKAAAIVHVVDDDAAVLHSLCALLQNFGFSPQSYPSAQALLSNARSLAFGCVLMDVRMPGVDGATAQRLLALERSDLPVILITGDGDVPMAVTCTQAGAANFLEKPVNPETLLRAIKTALLHHAEQTSAGQASVTMASLTDRENEVLALLVKGQSNKEIARTLGNSHRTVEIHRSHIMSKLGVKTTAQLIRTALAAGY